MDLHCASFLQCLHYEALEREYNIDIRNTHKEVSAMMNLAYNSERVKK